MTVHDRINPDEKPRRLAPARRMKATRRDLSMCPWHRDAVPWHGASPR